VTRVSEGIGPARPVLTGRRRWFYRADVRGRIVAATIALALVGCEITSDEPTTLEIDDCPPQVAVGEAFDIHVTNLVSDERPFWDVSIGPTEGWIEQVTTVQDPDDPRLTTITFRGAQEGNGVKIEFYLIAQGPRLSCVVDVTSPAEDSPTESGPGESTGQSAEQPGG